MKTFLKLIILLFLVGNVSCKDTTKEEAETKAALKDIEAVETTIEESSENLDKDLEELEIALKDLDSI